MKKNLPLLSLLFALLLAACAPAADNEGATEPALSDGGAQDVSILVYASPL